MDLSDLIDRNAAFTPAKAAVRFLDRAWSYAEFAVRIAQTARALKRHPVFLLHSGASVPKYFGRPADSSGRRSAVI